MKKFLMIFLTVCMAISCMIVPSFAIEPDDLPEFPINPDMYILYWGNNSQKYFVRLYVFGDDNTGDHSMEYCANSGNGYVLVHTGGSTMYQYSYDETSGWVYSKSASKDGDMLMDADGTLVGSSHDVFYQGTNDLFFRAAPPLAEVVEELTMEQSMAVQNQTVGVMKILVPCGVGCLALLMALPTLRKGFLRFLH